MADPFLSGLKPPWCCFKHVCVICACVWGGTGVPLCTRGGQTVTLTSLPALSLVWGVVSLLLVTDCMWQSSWTLRFWGSLDYTSQLVKGILGLHMCIATSDCSFWVLIFPWQTLYPLSHLPSSFLVGILNIMECFLYFFDKIIIL